MFSDWALAAWSVVGIAWWILAACQVFAEKARQAKIPADGGGAPLPELLSIFKPLAPLGSNGLIALSKGLESFISQLDGNSELILGVHESDRKTAAPFIEGMRTQYPQARLKVIHRSIPDELPNPKIAWQKFLAPQAEGELWLWSDSDIRAPAGFLDKMRDEYHRSGAAVLTFPYIVDEIDSRAGLFDAFYVNLEFYPGILLLRRFGAVDFGLGAGMLFRRSDFLRKVDWAKIGCAVADDFVLGRTLKPVLLSKSTLVTVTEVDSWGDAVQHYLRWSKTVWWSRPRGAAARVVVLPVLGWLIAVGLHPGSGPRWLGLAGMVQVDVFFAALLCRSLKRPVSVGDVLAAEVWSVWRILVWLACWIPWPVRWRGQLWWSALKSNARELSEHEDI